MPRVLLAVLVLAAFGAAPPATAESITVDWLSPRLAEVSVHSPALEEDSTVRVLVPDGFAQRSDRYPVLYLLHGAGDDETTWTSNTDVEAMTAGLDLVVVMPRGGGSTADFSDPPSFLGDEGNDAGWYSDWFNDGAFGPPRWSTHHLTEVLPLVEERFRAGGARERRAVAGLSMGGFGALSYAARHPDLFSFAASFSGAVDTNVFAVEGAGDALVTNPFVSRFGAPRREVWGLYTTERLRWQTHNPHDLAGNLQAMPLVLRTGDGRPSAAGPGDPVEVAIHEMNERMHARLTELGTPHEYHVTAGGTHAWSLWEADLEATLPQLVDTFGDPPAAPAAFRYRSAQPAFAVFSWSFRQDRTELAWLDLTGVSEQGLLAEGAGPLHVTTAALFEPGAVYAVAGEHVVADAQGRLAFTVDLDATSEVGIEPAGPAPAQAPEDPEPASSLPATGGGVLAGILLLAVSWTARRSLSRPQPEGQPSSHHGLE